jgi:hypothetical protein
VYVRCCEDLDAHHTGKRQAPRGARTGAAAGGALCHVHAVLGARILHGKVELVWVAQRRFVAQHLQPQRRRSSARRRGASMRVLRHEP